VERTVDDVNGRKIRQTRGEAGGDSGGAVAEQRDRGHVERRLHFDALLRLLTKHWFVNFWEECANVWTKACENVTCGKIKEMREQGLAAVKIAPADASLTRRRVVLAVLRPRAKRPFFAQQRKILLSAKRLRHPNDAHRQTALTVQVATFGSNQRGQLGHLTNARVGQF